MEQVMIKGNQVCNFELLKEPGSLRKLDGSIVSGTKGDVMVHYPNGDGDILSKKDFSLRFVAFSSISEQALIHLEEEPTEQPKPQTEDQPPVEPEQAPTEP
jgi:hypothetical protein